MQIGCGRRRVSAKEVRLRRSMPQWTPRRQLFPDGVISRLALVGSIKQQRLSPEAARVRSNPRIFVREAPGLDRGAVRTVQAGAHDCAINFRLANQVGG